VRAAPGPERCNPLYLPKLDSQTGRYSVPQHRRGAHAIGCGLPKRPVPAYAFPDFLLDNLPIEVRWKDKRTRGVRCSTWFSAPSWHLFSLVCRSQSSDCLSRALLTAGTQDLPKATRRRGSPRLRLLRRTTLATSGVGSSTAGIQWSRRHQPNAPSQRASVVAKFDASARSRPGLSDVNPQPYAALRRYE
jgi:hypothetical protein